CTVFAESEVISRLSAGVSANDIAAGVFASVAQRVAALARRIGVCEQVVLSGGAVCSAALPKALEKALGIPAFCSPLSQFNGALGAALYAQGHQE
ncbi:MAG: 2-hydroxyglutaryl-CoA dehydratase, partial [Coriobacteriales bacterium]|nr:2-hydroxyglutaryl-CoA dehydratase [Coriobacteriales bacterium]